MPNVVNTEGKTIRNSAGCVRSRSAALMCPGYNLQLAYTGTAVLLVSIIGCKLTSTYVPDAGTMGLGLGAIAVLTLPLILYLNERERFYLRDSLIVVVAAFYFTLLLGFPVTVAARLGMNIPLQDLHFERLDHLMGIHVPDIENWAAKNWIGIAVTRCYLLLFPFMQIAILLPIFIGKLKYSQRFIMANLIAFAIGLPLFALLPGVDPWYADHFMAIPNDAMCKAFVLLAIRRPGAYLYQYPAGAICFPSFHVIWAMLTAQVFWQIRFLRIPACILSALIIASTVTTGNHYFVDVIGGLIVAAPAMYFADRMSRQVVDHPVPSLRFRRS